MAACLCPIFNATTQFTNQGVILAGGKIQVYLAGTTAATDTWTTSALSAKNTNPIILDSYGRLPNAIWLQSGVAYKFVLMDSTGATVGIPYDNIAGTNDPTTAAALWTATGITPTYISATSFSMPGDVTGTLQVGRRIQATVTAGVVYGTIVTSTYSGGTLITTVTATMDSTSLDSGLSVVNVGTLPATNTPVPLVPGLTQSLQRQTYTAYTTGGTSTAFTITPAPVMTANTAGYEFEVTFNAASGVGATLSANGLAPLPLKLRGPSGALQNAEVPAGWVSKVYCDGSNWVVLNPPPYPDVSSLTVTVASNALTGTLSAETLDFRPVTLTSGASVTRASSSQSLTVPLSATLGTVNNVGVRLYWGWLDNAGTLEPWVFNTGGGTVVIPSEADLISTTAISAAAGSAGVFYSASARTNVAFRVRGYCDIVEATAGTWATGPTLVQGVGGGVRPRYLNRQTFTSSGTWTKPGYGNFAVVENWAGGGAGGGVGGVGNPAGGGGGGNYTRQIFPLSQLGSTETVTIGAGGTGVINAGGNPGGNTTFGTWLIAHGGSGGDAAATGAGGGGGGGLVGGVANANLGRFGGGSGGTFSGSEWGGGGGGSVGGLTFGGVALFGGGGGGSATAPTTAGTSVYGGAGGAGGGAGAAGTQPGGGGGGSTTVNTAGGAGGAGKCVVTVY